MIDSYIAEARRARRDKANAERDAEQERQRQIKIASGVDVDTSTRYLESSPLPMTVSQAREVEKRDCFRGYWSPVSEEQRQAFGIRLARLLMIIAPHDKALPTQLHVDRLVSALNDEASFQEWDKDGKCRAYKKSLTAPRPAPVTPAPQKVVRRIDEVRADQAYRAFYGTDADARSKAFHEFGRAVGTVQCDSYMTAEEAQATKKYMKEYQARYDSTGAISNPEPPAPTPQSTQRNVSAEEVEYNRVRELWSGNNPDWLEEQSISDLCKYFQTNWDVIESLKETL